MIETLINLKNNKLKRTAGQVHQGGEAVERCKKFLSGLSKKRYREYRVLNSILVQIHLTPMKCKHMNHSACLCPTCKPPPLKGNGG